MAAATTYDVIVIGTGTSAQVTSGCIRAAGCSVAVIDHLPFGGTCALRGCDPKKVLIGGAEAVDTARRMLGRGVTGEVRINWRDLIAFKRTFTDPVPAAQACQYAERGIDVYRGAAQFVGPAAVAVEGQVLHTHRHVLIATGARLLPLQFRGAEHVIASDQFLELVELPAHIVMVGGGYIAAEFSHIAACAGSKVTILQRAERMLTRFAPELVGWLMEKFAEIGVEVQTGTEVEAIKATDRGFRVCARSGNRILSVEANVVVHAAGRSPDLESLDLYGPNPPTPSSPSSAGSLYRPSESVHSRRASAGKSCCARCSQQRDERRIAMQVDPVYIARKNEEIALIGAALGRSRHQHVQTIEAAIEEKFRLGAELRAKHALQNWDNTETRWKIGAPLKSGPFAFSYRYQRADLSVTGPFPYRFPERLAAASVFEPAYTCSGMAAISAVLLAVAATAGAEKPAFFHLAECYKETLEVAVTCAGFRTIQIGATTDRIGVPGPPVILWLDCLPFGRRAARLDELARVADLVVFDTTAFAARSGHIRRFLQWARDAASPVVLVRSHTKLDTLGIEYGRLGSAVFVTFPEIPLAKLARSRNAARTTGKIVRLLGNAALPGHFCPYADGASYWRLSSQRGAALLHNGRLVASTLANQLGPSAVRQYQHGAFAALVPPHPWDESEAAAAAEQLANALTADGLPVRHAGSFGFDFVAVEGFFDSAVERHLLRLAAADLPLAVSAEIAEGVAAWWTQRWRRRVA